MQSFIGSNRRDSTGSESRSPALQTDALPLSHRGSLFGYKNGLKCSTEALGDYVLIHENEYSSYPSTSTRKLKQYRLYLLSLTPVIPVSPARQRKIRGSNPACDGIFPGRVIPVTSKLTLQWLPCQAPGILGSAVELVSVYCDWVRQKV